MRAVLTVPAAFFVSALPAAALAGLAVDDFTGDGRLDVVATLAEPPGALRLLGLEKKGEATDLTSRFGLDGIRDAGELLPVDVDADGRLDLLVLPREGSPGALRLLVRGDGDAFRDATERAGLAGLPAVTAACVSDLDLDGRLDLVVGSAGDQPFVRLFKGRGDGGFEEITATAGVTAEAPCAGIALVDTDLDDLPELYLSLRDAPNSLWWNGGGGTFSRPEGADALAAPAASGPAWFFDYDNDRDHDLFVAPPTTGGAPRLFENERDGRWKDVTELRGLGKLAGVRRAAFGDLDNDGYVELVLSTADEVFALANERGRSFAAMEEPAGVGDLAPGAALTVADLDYDGQQDVVVSIDGVTGGSVFGEGAFRNPGNKNLWVSVGVEGAASNRFGVGCLVRVLGEDARGKRRDYFRRVGEGSAVGGSLRQDVGLGAAVRILRLEVYWPATKQWQSYFHPKDKCTLIVEEGGDELVTVFRGPPRASR